MATIERIIPMDLTQEATRAREVAKRYYHEFVDLREVRIDHDLFHSIPVDLMFRYHFVPIQDHNGTLEIALADPRNLNLIDELAVLLGKKLRVKVATHSQISDLLKKTEQAQRGGFGHRAGYQTGGYDHLQRTRAARERYSHRDPRPGGGHQVPD